MESALCKYLLQARVSVQARISLVRAAYVLDFGYDILPLCWIQSFLLPLQTRLYGVHLACTFIVHSVFLYLMLLLSAATGHTVYCIGM